jgi:hypothetical protein
MTAAPVKQEFVYKQVDGVDISVDVYYSANSKSSPVLVWFHGGNMHLLVRQSDRILKYILRNVQEGSCLVHERQPHRTSAELYVQDIISVSLR